MGLIKSFIVSFVVFIALNFVMNLLILLGKSSINQFFFALNYLPLQFFGTFFNIESVGVMFPGYGILYSTYLGVGWLDIYPFSGIMLILASFLPSLIASILAGKMANTSKHAFAGFMFSMILDSIILVILYLINPEEMLLFTTFIRTFTSGYLVIVCMLIFGILNGIFWSGIAVIVVKEEKLKEVVMKK